MIVNNTPLDNNYIYPFTYNKLKYQCAEAAFLAQKCPLRRREFTTLDAKAARRLANWVQATPEWEKEKRIIMYQVLTAKFENVRIRSILLNTYGEELIYLDEDDFYWGTDEEGNGMNNLGRLLMAVRDDYWIPF